MQYFGHTLDDPRWLMTLGLALTLALGACAGETPTAGQPYNDPGLGTPVGDSGPAVDPGETADPATPACPPQGVQLNQPGYCTADCPCNAGLGACVSDDQCAGELVCQDLVAGDVRRCGPATAASEVQTKLWQGCEADEDCASGKCACWAGSTTAKVCLPGEAPAVTCSAKKSSYQACEADEQCKSNRCACYGSSKDKRKCLPDTVVSVRCEKPLWGFCDDGGECASQKCGCFGGNAQKMCLDETIAETSCGKAVDFEPCALPGDCASNRCRRCYTDHELCLPATMASHACVGQAAPTTERPSWSACDGDADCESGRCRCSASFPGDERCLPSSVTEATCSTASTTPGDDVGGGEVNIPGSCITLQTSINLNIRSGAGLEHAVLGKAPPGAVVELLGPVQGCWHEVRYCTISGWAYSNAEGCDPKYAGWTWINPSVTASCAAMACY